MRKLLLATTAALGASLGGAGIAQAQITTIPTLVPGTSPFSAATPAPGTVIVRLGGRVEAFFGVGADSGDKVTIPATNGVAGSVQSSGVAAGSYKQDNYYLGEYVRLYPSVDGVAANGLQYGAFVEIRHENYVAAGGGGSLTASSGGSSVSASDRQRGTLYVRRVYAYLGTPQGGTIRVGTTDGPTGLFETGTFENFDTGGWNGDPPNFFSTGAYPTWPFPGGVGNEYATSKIVYLSPQFYGFDFGASWEPSTANANDYDGGNPLAVTTSATGATSIVGSSTCGFASPGCDRLSSSSLAGSAGRRKNMVEFDSRYRGTFGPVGLAVEAGWVGSQHVAQDGAVAVRYNGFNYGVFGTTVTVGGFTVGGHIQAGDFNGQFSLKPVGATPAFAWIAGTSYTVGPLIVGASFFQFNSAGSSGPLGTAAVNVGQLRERGVAAGGTYTLAPGVALFGSYLYGDRKENGVNLLGDGESIVSPTGQQLARNQTTAQGIFTGMFVRW